MTAAALTRRSLLLCVAAVGGLSPVSAFALDRIPLGGTLRMRWPWTVSQLDPFSLYDPTATVFGGALFDSLYGVDAAGRPYPVLADGLPEVASKVVRIRLRPHLRTGRNRQLRAADVAWSLQRSARFAGRPLLSPFGSPKADGDAIVFPRAEPTRLARTLANPIFPIVPRTHSSAEPDGTGAFKATTTATRLTLGRNLRAARGPAYLDGVVVTRSLDLADGLRAFEMDQADVGWLGAGLHRRRRDAVAFDAGGFGWVVLRTGRELGAWGAPGVAQRLADGVATSQLARYSLKRTSAARGPVSAWNGPPTTLLAQRDSPYMMDLAGTIAAVLSRSGHELEVQAMAAPDLERQRRSGRFGLMLDFVRFIANDPADNLLGLLHAADSRLSRKAPRLSGQTAHDLTRTLRLGVLGQTSIVGAHAERLRGLESWQLGDCYQLPANA